MNNPLSGEEAIPQPLRISLIGLTRAVGTSSIIRVLWQARLPAFAMVPAGDSRSTGGLHKNNSPVQRIVCDRGGRSSTG